MSQLDRGIDELYKSAPTEFTAARTALAKGLTGEAARRVRALKKPTVVPWAVNQVFRQARPRYDAAMERGRALRDAQIATLKGRKADVRAATEAHRAAVAAAVRAALDIASRASLKPHVEQLTRMFEAISLASNPPPEAGRFTELAEPSGFEALTGVRPAKRARPEPMEPDKRTLAEERLAQRRAEADLEKATRQRDRAQERAKAARRELERAEADVASAERVVADYSRRSSHKS